MSSRIPFLEESLSSRSMDSNQTIIVALCMRSTNE